MNEFVLALLKNINITSILLALYEAKGESAVRRFLTVPEAYVRKACAAMGTDPEQALKERNESVEAQLEFIRSIADQGFTAASFVEE